MNNQILRMRREIEFKTLKNKRMKECGNLLVLQYICIYYSALRVV